MRIPLLHQDHQFVLRHIDRFWKQIGHLLHEFGIASEVGVGHLTRLHLRDEDAATVVDRVDPDALRVFQTP